MNENPGPGAYFDERNRIIIEGDDEVKNSFQFKSNVVRKDFAEQGSNIVAPPIGMYNIDMYDIANQNKNNLDEHRDLIPNKIAFNIGATWFKKIKEDVIQENQDEDEAK